MTGAELVARTRLVERQRLRTAPPTNDLAWLGLLLMAVSAAIMITLVWWLLT